MINFLKRNLSTQIKRLIAEAMVEALGSLRAPPEDRESSGQLRNDLDLMVRHGKRLETLTNELHKYSHENIHALRNVTLILQGLLDQANDAIARQERMIEELRLLIAQPNPPTPLPV